MWVLFFTGDKVTRLINEQGDNTLGYDDLGRLSYRVPTGGANGPTLSWSYDRYGNRLNQAAGGTGGSAPQISLNINPYDNKVNGYTYDLAGNLINDGAHSYTYDQEGNLIYVDNGQTAWDNYDALNRRILHATAYASGNYTNYLRYEYGIDGKLAGVWQNEETYEKLNRYYGPKGDSFAYWTGGTNLSNEVVHYQHTDYLGTVKARTDQNHNVEAYYSDLPFGERVPTAGTDDNTEHYATLDRDNESDTHHAQFRTYEPRIGRWLQPDPYDGSYGGSPQSWNRYSYVLNNPLGFLDATGLDRGYDCGYNCVGVETDDFGGTGLVWQPFAYQPGCYNPSSARMCVDDISYAQRTNASARQIAPSNGTKYPPTIQSRMQQAAHALCGASPATRVAKSVIGGFVIGFGVGAFKGFVAGELFGGEVSLGATGVVGAVAGGFIQGAVGAVNGLGTGTALAAECKAGFVYDHN